MKELPEKFISGNLVTKINYKFGAKPNVNPLGTLSPIGGLIQGVEISPAAKSCSPKSNALRRMRIVNFGWVNTRTCNFFVSGPKFTIFFSLNPAGIIVDQVCFQLLISQSVSKIFVVKLKICPILGRIFKFLALPNAHFMARHMVKYCSTTPTNDKVIGTDMLNFKLIFDPPLKKDCKGNPCPQWKVC